MATKKDRKKLRYSNAKEAAKKLGGDFTLTTVNLGNVPLFTFGKPGVYRLDILPYEVVKSPTAEKGTLHYERKYGVHKSVGPNGKWFICPFDELGKACPICENRGKLKQQGKPKEVIVPLYPKERQIMAVIDTEDREKGVQILEGPFRNGLGELLKTEIDGAEDPDDPAHTFYSLTDGYTLKILVKEEPTGSGGTFKKPVSVKFLPRKKQYSEKILDEVPSLDELLIVPTYNEIKKAYFFGQEEEDEEDDREEMEEDDDLEEEEDDEDTDDEEEEPKAKRGRGRPKKKVEEEDDDLDEDDDDEEEDDEPKVKRGRGRPKKKVEEDDEEEEPEEEDEDDDEGEEDADSDDLDEDDDEEEEEEEKPKRGRGRPRKNR